MFSVNKYLHGAISAQCNPKIDFLNSDFVILEKSVLEDGKIPVEAVKEYRSFFQRSEENNISREVLIAARTVVTHFNEGVRQDNQPEDLTCVFFVPAKLDLSSGTLSFSNKPPIIPREFLYPLIDPEISIGTTEKLNQYLSENVAVYKKISSWEEYWKYCREMFEYVTGQPFDSNCLSDDIKFDKKCYLIKNEMVVSTMAISELYDHIQKEKSPLPLYQTLISLKCTEPVELTSIKDISSMESHCASMNGKYPLSDSQRESVIHFNRLNDGEILAVNGPPGTGKTTLLQSIVAGMVTEHAISKKDAPLIVASSTNNQAVTNIIDSFGKIDVLWKDRCLEERWLPDINSFAVYFPSSSKDPGNYQCIDREYSFLAGLSTPEYKNKAKSFFVSKFNEYTEQTLHDLSECGEYLHSLLCSVDKLRRFVIKQTDEIFSATKMKSEEYLALLNDKKMSLCNKKNKLKENEKEICRKNDSAVLRMKEWNESYSSLPFLVRTLRPLFKSKLNAWFYEFRNQEESEILILDKITLDNIKNAYIDHIKKNDSEIQTVKNDIFTIDNQIYQLDREINEISNKINIILNQISENSIVSSVFSEKQLNKIRSCVISDTNEIMDTTLRYLEFWLAVHYYECSFLEEKSLTEKQLKNNISEVQINKLRQLSMICSCMVMTFFMLPRQMKIYNYNEKVNSYLFNHIDLLIADEAGQTSPEIAAASFSLAKKAVIVGDEFQIPPVWGTSSVLDISLAVEAGVINSPDEFETVKKKGLSVSDSSLMRTASNSCKYHKFSPGLFLTEHRRCYDEIINYCNDLLYDGHLKPCRGKSKSGIPCMAYYNIPVSNAQRDGTSRSNKQEAVAIAKWINANFAELCNLYPDKKPENLLAVITPFKAQTTQLRRAIKTYCTSINNPNEVIKVGTVHTFQGAEREIIIFSTVYGSNDRCGFIDSNKNLMNVAVSRAKDAFWIFGSIDCIKGKSRDTAGGLLYEYVCGSELNDKI